MNYKNGPPADNGGLWPFGYFAETVNGVKIFVQVRILTLSVNKLCTYWRCHHREIGNTMKTTPPSLSPTPSSSKDEGGTLVFLFSFSSTFFRYISFFPSHNVILKLYEICVTRFVNKIQKMVY